MVRPELCVIVGRLFSFLSRRVSIRFRTQSRRVGLLLLTFLLFVSFIPHRQF